ncbi:Imm21 family immunity protein [Streptomyces erythrochromogenes]|uniref:Imm21 family immunity protein n=1 Tax=Streptomyces erythrochromogenes TaxID=285574 RepID=UPI003689B51B
MADGLAGVIAVGGSGARALVLADEPSTSATCPGTAPSCAGRPPTPGPDGRPPRGAVLADPATEWEERGTWMSDGPAVLISAEAGVEYPTAGCPSCHNSATRAVYGPE